MFEGGFVPASLSTDEFSAELLESRDPVCTNDDDNAPVSVRVTSVISRSSCSGSDDSKDVARRRVYVGRDWSSVEGHSEAASKCNGGGFSENEVRRFNSALFARPSPPGSIFPSDVTILVIEFRRRCGGRGGVPPPLDFDEDLPVTS